MEIFYMGWRRLNRLVCGRHWTQVGFQKGGRFNCVGEKRGPFWVAEKQNFAERKAQVGKAWGVEKFCWGVTPGKRRGGKPSDSSANPTLHCTSPTGSSCALIVPWSKLCGTEMAMFHTSSLCSQWWAFPTKAWPWLESWGHLWRVNSWWLSADHIPPVG